MKLRFAFSSLIFAFATLAIISAGEKPMLNPTLKTIFDRKSVRHFKGGEISRDTLELIVKAGMAAPTGKNIQPWQFVVVTDKAKLNQMADSLPNAKMLREASAAIIVCGMDAKEFENGSPYWMLDCSNASENILLAIESLGLGGLWTAGWPYDDRMDPIRKILNIPANVIPLNVIPIGYPTGEDKPKDKFKPERIHWDTWK